MTEEVINIGDEVLCDLCNTSYKDVMLSGGAIVGSYAICPKCFPDHRKALARYGELHHVKEHCPPGQSFWRFVLEYRRRVYGKAGDEIRVTSFDRGGSESGGDSDA